MRHQYLCVLLAVASVGCGPASPPTDTAVIAAIRSAPSPERMHAINDAAHRERGESASLVSLLADADPQVRWAAAYVAALWADDAADVAALAPYLDAGDDSTRAVIAGSLAGLGHAGARQTLSSLAGSQVTMPFSDPPLTVGHFASEALVATGRAGAPR